MWTGGGLTLECTFDFRMLVLMLFHNKSLAGMLHPLLFVSVCPRPALSVRFIDESYVYSLLRWWHSNSLISRLHSQMLDFKLSADFQLTCFETFNSSPFSSTSLLIGSQIEIFGWTCSSICRKNSFYIFNMNMSFMAGNQEKQNGSIFIKDY